MSSFLLGANERIGKTNKLVRLFKLVNWDHVDKCLSSFRKNALYSLGGPKGYDKLLYVQSNLIEPVVQVERYGARGGFTRQVGLVRVHGGSKSI